MDLIRRHKWSLLSMIATYASLAIYRFSAGRPLSLSLKIIAAVAFVISPVSAIAAMLKEPKRMYGVIAFALSCFSFFLNTTS